MFFLSISNAASNTGDEKAILTPYTGKRCQSSRWIIFVAPRRLFSWYHRRSFEKRSTFRWWQTYVLAYWRWWWSYHDQSFFGHQTRKGGKSLRSLQILLVRVCFDVKAWKRFFCCCLQVVSFSLFSFQKRSWFVEYQRESCLLEVVLWLHA